jgi:transposase-like protein
MNAENSIPKVPQTLVEAVLYFSNPSVALDFFVKFRWPNGVCCPRCGSTNVLFLAKYSRWKCREKHLSPQFTVKVGSIMEDSPLGLDKWAVCIWLEVNAKNSISSYEIARALGITQKSAWFMLHRVRHALQSGSFGKLSGTIEADETFIGGLAKNMHKAARKRKITGTGGANKAIVMGLLERHSEHPSQVIAKVVADRQHDSLHDVIRSNVEKNATIYTDAYAGYHGLSENYVHDFVDHAEAYVKGAVHTNGLENFWSLFKRCIKGTHVSVEPFHLTRYVDSEAFRFNNRDLKDGGRFAIAVRGLAGKRITYKQLTATEDRIAGDNGNDAASDDLLN